MCFIFGTRVDRVDAVVRIEMRDCDSKRGGDEDEAEEEDGEGKCVLQRVAELHFEFRMSKRDIV